MISPMFAPSNFDPTLFERDPFDDGRCRAESLKIRIKAETFIKWQFGRVVKALAC
jgi:hypothetical protein